MITNDQQSLDFQIKMNVIANTNSSSFHSVVSLGDAQSFNLLLTLVLVLDSLGLGAFLATLHHEDEDDDAGEKSENGNTDPESDLQLGHVAGVSLGIRQFLLHDVFVNIIKLSSGIGESGIVESGCPEDILELLVPLLILWSSGGVEGGGEDPGGHQEDHDPGFHHGW